MLGLFAEVNRTSLLSSIEAITIESMLRRRNWREKGERGWHTFIERGQPGEREGNSEIRCVEAEGFCD